MNDEPKLVESPLSQSISSGGKTVSIEIYHLENETTWTLEIVDEFSNSTVWDDPFQTDSEALVEAKKTILAEGVNTLVGPEDGKNNDNWR